jgi:FAD binding domain
MANIIGRTLDRLAARLPGRVPTPGDDGHADATVIWSKPIGRMPRAVVHCRTVEDVQAAIRAARDCGPSLSVRGGAHDWAGRAVCDGVVIDMSGMNGVTVASDQTATVSGGTRAVDVAAATHPYGLTAVTGSVGAVGMAGFTLGGGYGSLIGRFGLGLDNLEAAEIVLADGRVVVARPENEPDLLWALRGGAAILASSPRCASNCILCGAFEWAWSFIRFPRPRPCSNAALTLRIQRLMNCRRRLGSPAGRMARLSSSSVPPGVARQRTAKRGPRLS